MRFHVNIVPRIPPDTPKDLLADLFKRETEAGLEFMRAGKLVSIDRVAGRGGNISVWEVDSPEQLDEILNGLPLAPYLSFEVTPLVKHRVQIAYEALHTKS